MKNEPSVLRIMMATGWTNWRTILAIYCNYDEDGWCRKTIRELGHLHNIPEKEIYKQIRCLTAQNILVSEPILPQVGKGMRFQRRLVLPEESQ